jgi:lipid-binding SYLF domain-containing protein
MKTNSLPLLIRVSLARPLIVILALLLLAQAGFAEDRDKLVDRVNSAGTVLNEIMSAPDANIPDQILGSAQCVAVVPGLLKGGFIVGGTYGNGVASCRTPKGWSAPAFFRVEGGSFGLQIGGQSVDLVMVVMNDKGMRDLLEAKFKLGADASVAAGPVGRLAEGSTDWKMRAEVLTYSRARGVFAGISLNGAVIRQDNDDTRGFYGRMVPYKTILTGGIEAPSDAQPFLAALNKYAPVTAPGSQSATQPAPSSPPAAGGGQSQPQPQDQSQPQTQAPPQTQAQPPAPPAQ